MITCLRCRVRPGVDHHHERRRPDVIAALPPIGDRPGSQGRARTEDSGGTATRGLISCAGWSGRSGSEPRTGE
jgi:hypothetical protein